MVDSLNSHPTRTTLVYLAEAKGFISVLPAQSLRKTPHEILHLPCTLVDSRVFSLRPQEAETLHTMDPSHVHGQHGL